MSRRRPTIAGIDADVLALGTARMADAVANSFLVIVLPLYIASGEVRGTSLGLPVSAVTGIVLAVFGLSNAVAQPFAGRLSDRVGRRKAFVLAGLTIITVLNLSYTLAHSYVAIGLLRIGQGLGVAMTVTASVALVNEVSERRTRGGNMGAYNSLRLLGFGSGPLAAGLVVSSGPYALPWGGSLSGYDAAFWMAGLGAMASAGLVLLLVRDPERLTEDVGAMEIAVRARDGEHLLDPIFTLGIATLTMATCISLLSAIEPVVNERLDQGARWFGVQFAVFIITLALAQPFVGRASDRHGRRRFILWGLASLVPTTLAQGLVVTSWQLFAARLAQGLSGALIFAPALALAGDLARRGQSGLQLSVLTMAFTLGLSLGQLSAGFMVSRGYVVPFAFGSLLAVGAALLVGSQVGEDDPLGHGGRGTV